MGTREIILDGAVVPDNWVHLDDSEPVPDHPGQESRRGEVAKVIISLERWLEHREALRGRPNLGVRLDGRRDVTALADDLPHLAMVALHFPKFGDGRAYSQARILRERLAYDGQIRAFGQVLRDQVFYMHRCGFDVIEVDPSKQAADVARGLGDFTVVYQAAADGAVPVYRQRAHSNDVA